MLVVCRLGELLGTHSCGVEVCLLAIGAIAHAVKHIYSLLGHLAGTSRSFGIPAVYLREAYHLTRLLTILRARRGARVVKLINTTCGLC